MNLPKKWKGLSQVWTTYWFRPAPLFNLAVCRIFIVAFQLFYLINNNYISKIFDLSALPNSQYKPLPILQLLVSPLGWNYNPPFAFLAIVFWLTLVVGLLALIGLKTNLSLIFFAVGNIFMQAYIYSFGDYHHPEALMIITLSLLALSPAGKVLSIDDLRHRIQQNIKRRRFEVFNIMTKKSVFARWSLLLVQWMFALIYLSAALSKLGKPGPGLFTLDWMNGYTLQYYLLRDGLRWGSDLGIWLGQHHTLAWIASCTAILFEGTFFLVLIFPGLIWLYIPMGAALHTGIYLTQRAPFFQYIAIYAVFIPWTSVIKTLSRRQRFARTKNKPELLYDGLCPLCIRSMTVLCYFDWVNCITYSDLEKRWLSVSEIHPEISLEACREEMHLLLPNGSVRKGFFAFREILRYLPPLWPLLVVCHFPAASTIGPKIYKFVASRRPQFDRCSYGTCSINFDDK
ncbi:MAG: hypothetical protein BRC34_08670 [Cyanobacteria bacterium QH_1_48_107]|nr:MAG: hypothetical protein BRC34_08670 [Cyanobacteria bacterium QH_1_48_107]